MELMLFIIQLESEEEVASMAVNLTADPSVLQSPALAVFADIIQDLTSSAIEQPEVWSM